MEPFVGLFDTLPLLLQLDLNLVSHFFHYNPVNDINNINNVAHLIYEKNATPVLV